jgi:hypothetical protein
MRFLALAFALAFLSISATAQTAKDLNTKYGAPRDSYEIRSGIFATTKFAPDGRLCEMSVEKRHVKSSGAILVDETLMSQDEMTPIVGELVPINERGKESTASGLIRIMGVGMTTTYDYENVRITYYAGLAPNHRSKAAIVVRGTAAIVIQWKNRGCSQQ